MELRVCVSLAAHHAIMHNSQRNVQLAINVTLAEPGWGERLRQRPDFGPAWGQVRAIEDLGAVPVADVLGELPQPRRLRGGQAFSATPVCVALRADRLSFREAKPSSHHPAPWGHCGWIPTVRPNAASRGRRRVGKPRQKGEGDGVGDGVRTRRLWPPGLCGLPRCTSANMLCLDRWD